MCTVVLSHMEIQISSQISIQADREEENSNHPQLFLCCASRREGGSVKGKMHAQKKSVKELTSTKGTVQTQLSSPPPNTQTYRARTITKIINFKQPPPEISGNLKM